MNEKGISLLELIIYIAVFSVVSIVMIQIFLVVLRGRDIANVRFEVSQNMRFATEKIRQAVFDAFSIVVSGSCPLNTLDITTGSATSSFFISGNILKFSNASGTSDITTNKIIATTTPSDCLFSIISNSAPAKSTLQAKLKIVYNNEDGISESQQITVSLR